MTAPRIKTAVGPTILLASGHYFDLLDPAGSRFTIGDIAAGLAKTCRFAGQCRRFYSVAQHSILVSRLVPEELALAALMHDAAEAFIGDVTRPLKSLLPEYRTIEKRIEGVIFERFGLGDLPNDPRVKQADLSALDVEQRVMMPDHQDRWSTSACIEPIQSDRIVYDLRFPDSPRDAEGRWLEQFERIAGVYPVAEIEHRSGWAR